ncbi:ketopantoate reductase family protein [Kerstersia sp.]|uniref:ketopantoate reductase family protein n=1 Tax=Kerstersia sp. TaxID=1930783 RepID=UPI003F8F3847
MKICVLGAGALGSVIGGALARAGEEVWLLSRSAAHVEAVRREGLRMHEGARCDTVAGIHATSLAAEVGVVDVLIVLVKSFDTVAALQAAACVVGPETVVMSLQNGLGHEEVLARLVGREKVIAGKTYVGGVMLAPGEVQAGIAGKETLIGELDGSSSGRVTALAGAFNRAGLATTASRNIMAVIWDKLLINVATGAVSGITRLPYGQLYAVPEIEAIAIEAVSEAMDVARAQGLRLSIENARQAWLMAAEGLGAEFKTSMLQSLEKHSRTEIDYVNGAVVRLGQALGLDTPVNRTLVACIKGLEAQLPAHA